MQMPIDIIHGGENLTKSQRVQLCVGETLMKMHMDALTEPVRASKFKQKIK